MNVKKILSIFILGLFLVSFVNAIDNEYGDINKVKELLSTNPLFKNNLDNLVRTSTTYGGDVTYKIYGETNSPTITFQHVNNYVTGYSIEGTDSYNVKYTLNYNAERDTNNKRIFTFSEEKLSYEDKNGNTQEINTEDINLNNDNIQTFLEKLEKTDTTDAAIIAIKQTSIKEDSTKYENNFEKLYKANNCDENPTEFCNSIQLNNFQEQYKTYCSGVEIISNECKDLNTAIFKLNEIVNPTDEKTQSNGKDVLNEGKAAVDKVKEKAKIEAGTSSGKLAGADSEVLTEEEAKEKLEELNEKITKQLKSGDLSDDEIETLKRMQSDIPEIIESNDADFYFADYNNEFNEIVSSSSTTISTQYDTLKNEIETLIKNSDSSTLNSELKTLLSNMEEAKKSGYWNYWYDDFKSQVTDTTSIEKILSTPTSYKIEKYEETIKKYGDTPTGVTSIYREYLTAANDVKNCGTDTEKCKSATEKLEKIEKFLKTASSDKISYAYSNLFNEDSDKFSSDDLIDFYISNNCKDSWVESLCNALSFESQATIQKKQAQEDVQRATAGITDMKENNNAINKLVAEKYGYNYDEKTQTFESEDVSYLESELTNLNSQLANYESKLDTSQISTISKEEKVEYEAEIDTIKQKIEEVKSKISNNKLSLGDLLEQAQYNLDNCKELSIDCDKARAEREVLRTYYGNIEVETTAWYSIIDAIKNPDKNGLKASKLFGFEADYSNLPSMLGETLPSQICLDKIDGYLDKEVENDGGVTKYNDNANDLDVIADLRAQRSAITPDNKTQVTYSYYVDDPEEPFSLSIKYVQNGDWKTFVIENSSSSQNYDSVGIPLNTTEGIEPSSFTINLDTGDIHLTYPIILMSTSALSDTIESTGNSAGNEEAIINNNING